MPTHVTPTLHIANMFMSWGRIRLSPAYRLLPLRCVAKVSMYSLTVSIAQRKLNVVLNPGAKRRSEDFSPARQSAQPILPCISLART